MAKEALGGYMKNNDAGIRINVDSIPNTVRDNLAAATLEYFKAFLQIPGNAEWLDTRSRERKQKMNHNMNHKT